MNTNQKSVSEIRVQDPLSEVTRKERRNLLISSFVGLIIVTTGLVPTKINSFGIEFSTTQRDSFFVLTSILIFYFLATFIVYASSDFVAWRISFNATRLGHLKDLEKERDPEPSPEKMKKLYERLWKWTKVSMPVSFLRALIEFVFPILFGLYAALKIIYYK
ncbi:MAG: hypothetical protein Q8L04_00455 [Ignavibacteria bacterium]|nr:hypothetical protein [Ignavibacteria bacterium]